MAEIVNLNRARKAKAHGIEKDKAAQNRAAFGRTKAEKAVARAALAKSEKSLDDHKRGS